MGEFNMKEWFRGGMKPYLKYIKQKMSEIAGTFEGYYTNVAAFPVEAQAGDYVILTEDDGSNESGFYAYDGANWGYFMDITSFEEAVNGLVASQAEFDSANNTEKVPTVAQVHTHFAKKNGDGTQKFSVAAPEEGSDQAVRASDFDFTISDAEAQEDWEAA